MKYQKYLIKTIAAESHFWKRIDKKYDEIGNYKLTQKQEVLNVINELPPKALLRAIKLLVINDAGKTGQAFVADLLGKVYKKEITYLIENKNELSFEKYLAHFGSLNQNTSEKMRLVAIYLHLRKVMGLPEDPSELLQMIIQSEGALDQEYRISPEAMHMAADWLKAHGNIKTLNDLTYDETLFTEDFFAVETLTKKENIPLRAFESYEFTKNDIADMIDIANSNRRPYDLNRYLTTGFILKSLARYAKESKDAYMELALSGEASPNKTAKKELARLQAEIDQLHAILNKKQEQLNKLQLDFDRLQKSSAESWESLEQLRDYTETLELQLVSSEDAVAAAETFTKPDFSGKKVVVIGGHANWQARLHEKFSDFTFVPVDEFNFDVSIIKNADLIIFNFAHCSHKQFYRMRENCDRNKIVYVANTNIDVLMKQFAKKQ